MGMKSSLWKSLRKPVKSGEMENISLGIYVFISVQSEKVML